MPFQGPVSRCLSSESLRSLYDDDSPYFLLKDAVCGWRVRKANCLVTPGLWSLIGVVRRDVC